MRNIDRGGGNLDGLTSSSDQYFETLVVCDYLQHIAIKTLILHNLRPYTIA